MDFIIDVQGFKGPTNEFILKEFSIIRADEKNATPVTLTFESPYAWDCLPSKYKITNKWLEWNFHGISWEYGAIPYVTSKPLIQSILQRARTVYVKGYEKSLWLASSINPSTEIIDLETLDCPPLKKLLKTSPSCPHHLSDFKFNCAMRNVVAMKSWFFVYRALCVRGILE